MTPLKQSTTVTVQLGPAVDKTDGVTAETGLSPTVEISKNNGTFAARNSATAISHDQQGWYRVEIDSTDTNTVGRLIAKFDDDATHLPVWHEFVVLEEAIYDALFAASANAFAGAAGSTDFNATQKASINTEADNAIVTYRLNQLVQTSVVGADIADNSIIAKLVSKSATADWDDFANTTDSLQAIRDKETDIETDTAEIGAAGAGLTAIPWNANWDAEVQSEVKDALVAEGLDHLVNAAVVGADITDNSIIGKLVSSQSTADWDDFDNTTDSLQALRDDLGKLIQAMASR